MTLTNEELESLEKSYLDQLYFYLESNKDKLMTGLHSKDKIRDDWWDEFQSGGKATDLDRGAERIFYWLLAGLWIPNSAPIGSNLFFESYNVFIHIEVKTARVDNPADYKGIVPMGKAQTTYEAHETHRGTRIETKPTIPKYYNVGKENEKPCLTYAIQIIHDPETLDMIAILLICIPNGQLYDLYGTKIVNAGKIKDESFRYRYKGNPRFESLPEKPYRVKILHFDEKSGYTKKDITSVELTNYALFKGTSSIRP